MIEPFVKQERLVSGTNIKTINGVSQLGSGNLSVSGSVATDAIWDAAGDLAVGTGLDTAARLACGTALQVIQVNAGATTIEYVDTTGTGSVMRAISPIYVFIKTTEVSHVPTGITRTITLTEGNLQTLDLASTTGSVTVTIVVTGAASASGRLILRQHATTPRDITWSSAATIRWAGTQPTWSGDAVSSERIVAWTYDGTKLLLGSTEVTSANS